MTVSPRNTEQLYRELHEGLRSFVSYRVPSAEDAEDIVQEIFARIHTHSDELEHAESVTGWIYRVTRNAIIDHHRAGRAAARATARLTHEMETMVEDPVEPSSARELARCVEPLVAQLQDDLQEALSLTDLGGLSQKKAAAKVGLSVSGMKSRVQRGRAKLGALLRNCCELELDHRSRLMSYERRRDESDVGCDC